MSNNANMKLKLIIKHSSNGTPLSIDDTPSDWYILILRRHAGGRAPPTNAATACSSAEKLV